jgi:DNA ligase (NAD+)
MRLEELRSIIFIANENYRTGDPIISDEEYDNLLDELRELNPDDSLLSTIGHEIVDNNRKVKLPIKMASMNKIKNIEDIKDWIRLKSIPESTIVVMTPKYDGLSLCVDEKTEFASTRGDGTFGQNSTEHYKLISNKLKSSDKVNFTYGEVIMKKSTFNLKYSKDFANPRNMVSGLLNTDNPTNALKDCDFVKYGAVFNNEFTTKTQLLDYLNENQDNKVNYHVCRASELNEDLLIELFTNWSVEYEIDGIIVEVNDLNLQKVLGRETSSGNPAYARAYKSTSFEQKVETEIIKIDWIISKNGLLKPIARLKPVQLDGVLISNVTCNNARFVKDMGLGSGSIVKIVRSGMVIPKIIDVIKKVDFEMPEIGTEIGWNENGVELITLIETDEQKIKKNIAFFEILEADNISDGIINQLWDYGFKTIKQLTELKKEDLIGLEGFGTRKAEIVTNSIKKSISNVRLSKLQHASGLFSGMGSKKLCLLEHFKTKPTIDEVIKIDGFAEISARTYVDSYDKFNEFIKDLPVTIEKHVEVATKGDNLKDFNVVFTGLRRKDLEDLISSNGGKVSSGVSKNTTHLVIKEKNSGSSKEKKAIELGIQILTPEEFEKLI